MTNFDTKLREKLEGRRIPPSASGWEKLAHELDNKKDKPKKHFWLPRIAAIFLGGILVGTMFFNQGEDLMEKESPLVEEGTENSVFQKSIDDPDQTVPLKQEALPTSKSLITTGSNKTKEVEKDVERHPVDKTQSQEKEAVLMAGATHWQEPAVNQNPKVVLRHLTETVSSTKVSDAEIERLLQEAYLEITSQAVFNGPPKNTISAQALLNSIKSETGRSQKKQFLKFVQDKLIELASTSRAFN